ncbi:methionine adenosyltransferase [Alloscardovia macacae]|uniref:S-adenosylmethionine synthase n=1 Tax=Alloscardovia macacae TaxID=1160091 RepID=A0A1Y2SZX2_9BIFI|nr:methionine adenosyltransferase [Alloscardovia macacae]OTA26987.1 methionine adenosyltransferase [Alloscardovia macacae]OTA30025.1 methionine adenosyltransferase [Alloscardovia macacae]
MTQDIHLFTSESVTEGHPDKVCDQISDAILDAYMAADPHSHVAVETCATAGQFVIFGEVSSSAHVNVSKVARNVLTRIGYTDSHIGLDADTVGIMESIIEQSAEINQGVSAEVRAKAAGTGKVNSAEQRYELQGAGDQGLMFGYATDETAELMPLPIVLAHKLAARLAAVRHQGIVPHLRPDGKTQVTVAYDEQEHPLYVDTVVVSTQHDPEVTQEWIRQQIRQHVVEPVLAQVCGEDITHADYTLLVNPTGSFVLGGPAADAGLTGRKIIVDTYGGAGHHGGGAFSGKDPSKVDRSAAYAARWVAKTIVAAGLAHRVEVQVAYAIGVADPVSVYVNTFGTQTASRAKIERAVKRVFDLRPAAIIDELGLLAPLYAKTAAYGHFGRPEFSWESTERAEALKAAVEQMN